MAAAAAQQAEPHVASGSQRGPGSTAPGDPGPGSPLRQQVSSVWLFPCNAQPGLMPPTPCAPSSGISCVHILSDLVLTPRALLRLLGLPSSPCPVGSEETHRCECHICPS